MHTINVKVLNTIKTRAFTSITVIGPEHEVKSWIQDYFNEYHPWGYSTKIENQEFQEGGMVKVSIRRYSSCD